MGGEKNSEICERKNDHRAKRRTRNKKLSHTQKKNNILGYI